MFRRYLKLPLYHIPPETGGAGGIVESSENVADGSVSSGTASEALLAAVAASESSSGEGNEPDAVNLPKPAGAAGDTLPSDGKAPVAKPDAKGPQIVAGKEAPQSRIEAAVKNAREQAVTETEAKYAWAKDLDEESVSTAFNLASELLSDSEGFTRKLAGELGFKLVPANEAGKPAEKAASTWDVTKLPKGALRSEDGIEAYSKDQLIEVLGNLRGSLLAELQGQMKPLMDRDQKAAIAQQHTEIQNAARETAGRLLTDMRKRPGFQVDDGKGGKIDNPKIKEYLQAIPQRVRSANPTAALYHAYTTFIEKDYLPNMDTVAAQRVRDDNKRKVAGSSGVRPGAGVVGEAPKPITSVSGLARRMEEMAAASAE